MSSEHYEIVAQGQPRLCRNQHKIEYNSSRLGCCTRIALRSYFGLLCKTNMKYKFVTMRSLHFFRFSDQAISGVLDVVSLFARGEAPTSIAPYLCGASLLALKKKDGGIRRIAVGETLRRLVAKCLCRLSSQKAASLLVPLQDGVGVPGGCEAVSHALNGLVASVGDTTSLAILQVDLKNAFNTLDRSSILRQVADQFPELLRWVEFCYCQPSWL